MAITDRNAVGEQRSFATLRFRGIADCRLSVKRAEQHRYVYRQGRHEDRAPRPHRRS